MTSPAVSYHGYRFPPEIISHGVWLYHRFCVSFRDAEDLLAQRGITVSYEAIRQWCRRFGFIPTRLFRITATRFHGPSPGFRVGCELLSSLGLGQKPPVGNSINYAHRRCHSSPGAGGASRRNDSRNPPAVFAQRHLGFGRLRVEPWEVEHGPQGEDELNIVRAGRNYGWPVISYGRAYTGELTRGTGGTGPELAEPIAPGMEQPFLFWFPVIAPGGMILYTGDRFPAWKGNLLIGGMASTQLHHVVMNQRGLPVRREALMTELKQRIRDVKQGPDGLVYLTTDHEAGALLRVEPVVDPQ